MSRPLNAPTPRWFTVIPLEYREDGVFWARDAGLFCLALRDIGVDAKFVAFGQPAVSEDRPMILATRVQMEDPAWWRQWQLDGVIFYSWGSPRFTRMARAIREAGAKLVIMLDSGGIISSLVSPSMYFRHKYLDEKHEGKWLPACRALIKTTVSGIRLRHAGMIEHLALGDVLTTPSSVAKQRFGRFLTALRRPDLAEKLRVLPHLLSTRMVYDPALEKKPLLIAVGTWDRWQKNAPLLVKVLREVLPRAPGYSARIVGSGESALRELLVGATPDCQARIQITGPLPNDQLPRHFQESRISICSSYSESFHIATGEALCCGCSFVGDARLAPMPFFASLAGCGTLACDLSLHNVADAVLAEIELWDAGLRDPAYISKTWTALLHADKVAHKVLELAQRSKG